MTSQRHCSLIGQSSRCPQKHGGRCWIPLKHRWHILPLLTAALGTTCLPPAVMPLHADPLSKGLRGTTWTHISYYSQSQHKIRSFKIFRKYCSILTYIKSLEKVHVDDVAMRRLHAITIAESCCCWCCCLLRGHWVTQPGNETWGSMIIQETQFTSEIAPGSKSATCSLQTSTLINNKLIIIYSFDHIFCYCIVLTIKSAYKRYTGALTAFNLLHLLYWQEMDTDICIHIWALQLCWHQKDWGRLS